MRLAGAIVYLLSSLQVSLDWPIHGKELRYQISIEIEVNWSIKCPFVSKCNLTLSHMNHNNLHNLHFKNHWDVDFAIHSIRWSPHPVVAQSIMPLKGPMQIDHQYHFPPAKARFVYCHPILLFRLPRRCYIVIAAISDTFEFYLKVRCTVWENIKLHLLLTN